MISMQIAQKTGFSILPIIALDSPIAANLPLFDL